MCLVKLELELHQLSLPPTRYQIRVFQLPLPVIHPSGGERLLETSKNFDKVVVGPEQVVCYDGTDITDLAMLIGLSHGDFLVVDGVTREESTSFLLQVVRVGPESPKSPFLLSPLSLFLCLLKWRILLTLRHTQFRRGLLTNILTPVSDRARALVSPTRVCTPVSDGTVLMEMALSGDDDKVKEIVLAKEFFAGGSTRWMFDCSYAKFEKDFEVHFTKVPSYQAVLSQAEGPEHPNAVNHLRGVTLTSPDRFSPFFISQYTVERLWKQCKKPGKAENFLKEAYAKARATGNPSFEGWIFEFGFLFLFLSRIWADDWLVERRLIVLPPFPPPLFSNLHNVYTELFHFFHFFHPFFFFRHKRDTLTPPDTNIPHFFLVFVFWLM